MSRFGIDTLFENPRRPTGATGYLELLVRNLVGIEAQDEFFLFVSPANRARFGEIVGSNWKLIECPFSNESIPGRIASQQTYIPWHAHRERLDVVNSPGNTAPVALGCASVLTIKTLHHLDNDSGIGLARILYRRTMIRASAARARLIIANSEDTATRIRERLGVPRERIRVVYEAVSSAFAPALDTDSVRRDVAMRYDIHAPFILFVSTLWPYKNAAGLIRAFRQLASEDGSLSLAIVGHDHGGQQSDLQALTRQLGLADRVQFVGFVPNQELRDLYCASEVFAYPSLQETFGLTLVEAMRCGVPIVASDTTAIPEILGGAGLLVTPGDDDALASALRRALSDEELRRTLIDKGLVRSQAFSPAEMARQTLSVYREAAAAA